MSNYNVTDIAVDQLLENARNGDEQALNAIIQRFEPEVRKIASKYFLQRADFEDIVQEGRIAIYKAVMSYSPKQGIPFLHFVRMVIRRKIIDLLRWHNRNKHLNFNEAYSLDSSLTDDNEATFIDLLQDHDDPESTIVALEEAKTLVQSISKQLSDLEKEVFKYHYLMGLKQKEICEELGLSPKTLDNAIQRIRRKSLDSRQRQAVG